MKTRTIRRSEKEDWIGPDIPSTTKKSYRSEGAEELQQALGERSHG